jgi:hypothetical protein
LSFSLTFVSFVAAAGFEAENRDAAIAGVLKDGVDAAERAIGWSNGLLERVRATLQRFAAELVPKSTATIVEQLVDAMAQEAGKEDPLDVAMEEQVTAGAKIVFSLLLARGVVCDFEELSTVYPKGKSGREMSLSALSAEAQKYAKQLVALISKRREEKKALKEARRLKKRSSSSKTTTGAP